MILGYPSVPSVPAGQTLLFHISTDAPELRIEVYRQGAALELVGSTDWLPGECFPSLAPHDDGSRVWRGHPFQVPQDFRSGAYIAMFVEGDGQGRERAGQRLDRTTADGREGKALFVVKNAGPRGPGGAARILYKIPLFTYCAYNAEGDPRGSLYTWPGRKVTLHRPGNGTGGTPWDAFAVDVYDPDTPRQTFAHWDAKLIRWLESNGYAVDYATDLDLHEDAELLSAYRLLISGGHDEYWSAPQRAHVEAFVERGGSVAFFSGNVCYWRVEVEDGGTALTIEKRVRPEDLLPADLWRRTLPENVLTGVSYANAGGQWNGLRPSGGGFTVRRSRHWVFEGTGLDDGDAFGEREAVVGYEADGAALEMGPAGVPVPTGADGTPLDFEILATSSLAGWEGAERGSLSTATMGLYARRGIVFTAATVDWARVLAAGVPAVDRITRNVLARLQAVSVRVSGAFPVRAGRPIAVEGEAGTFHVDTSALPPGSRLTYLWSISTGDPGPLDGPSLRVTMPSPRAPVTVSVHIDIEGDPHGAFGTLTVVPFTRGELLWFETRAQIEALSREGRAPQQAPGCGSRPGPVLPGSLYEPLDPRMPFFQRPESPPAARSWQAIRERAEAIAELARQMLEEPDREP